MPKPAVRALMALTPQPAAYGQQESPSAKSLGEGLAPTSEQEIPLPWQARGLPGYLGK